MRFLLSFRPTAGANCNENVFSQGRQTPLRLLLIRPQGNATLPPTHSAKSAEWMGHSVSKLLGRINNRWNFPERRQRTGADARKTGGTAEGR
jgi:hypothetical protein